MADDTRALLAEGEASRRETAQVLAELDAALEAYGRSIDRGLALAAEMHQLADTIKAGMADSHAELMEWFC